MVTSRIALRRIVAAALATVAAVAPAQAAVLADPGCYIAVEMSATIDLRWSDTDVSRFRTEAARVWTLAGVEVCWHDDRHPCVPAPMTIHVRIADEVPGAATDPRPALGWMGFTDDGPGPFIVLSARRARELLARAERAARRLGEIPGMVDRLLPRALGRALAHELGHYLLARRAHTTLGLMRDAFRPEDLADAQPTQRLLLTADDLRLLLARCGAGPATLASRFVPAR